MWGKWISVAKTIEPDNRSSGGSNWNSKRTSLTNWDKRARFTLTHTNTRFMLRSSFNLHLQQLSNVEQNKSKAHWKQNNRSEQKSNFLLIGGWFGLWSSAPSLQQGHQESGGLLRVKHRERRHHHHQVVCDDYFMPHQWIFHLKSNVEG